MVVTTRSCAARTDACTSPVCSQPGNSGRTTRRPHLSRSTRRPSWVRRRRSHQGRGPKVSARGSLPPPPRQWWLCGSGTSLNKRPDAEAVSPQELSASAARPYQSDRERGAGQGVDLHRHGDSGHPAAGQRQRLPQQQPPVGRGLTQRPKIGQQRAHPTTLGRPEPADRPPRPGWSANHAPAKRPRTADTP